MLMNQRQMLRAAELARKLIGTANRYGESVTAIHYNPIGKDRYSVSIEAGTINPDIKALYREEDHRPLLEMFDAH